ncbi:hypothetical protein PSI23_06290 [Xenorhabdus sp. XENO-10]|uniref:Uncharacterized protein n=1 Tax=Xenorhabdus yunnanensis TaxID=3025878 RepID=A0ABT5LD85_9GAMM|nr:hypothetical protein [Xenorhabdus yunnanensis]MDC9588935.1 hypothetical protein [Xenorhabdus yunnanensis]
MSFLKNNIFGVFYSVLTKVFVVFILMGSIQLSYAEDKDKEINICKSVCWQPI